MQARDIEWRSGTVAHWDLSSIDEGRELDAQVKELKEDLAQVQYPGDVVIDVGWYPEFSIKGAFVVTVVEHGRWDAPLMKERCRTTAQLRDLLRKAVSVAEPFP